MSLSSKFKSALDRVGYDYNVEDSGPLSDVYCRLKQVRTRGGRLEFLKDLGRHIPPGISAKGEGEIAIDNGEVTIEHLAGAEFAAFRSFLNLDEATYLDSFSEVTGGAISDGGRSGSLYWFSKDSRYILKSATSADVDKLVDMMPRYLAHFQEAEKAGRDCFLLRLLGLYRFRSGDQVLALICMNDVWNGQKPDRIYDLKGTTANRYVDIEDEQDAKGCVLKDLNLVSYFLADKSQGPKVQQALAADTSFLASENSIDYSLLLGVDDGNQSVQRVPKTGKRDLQELPCYKWYEYVEEYAEESGKYGCWAVDLEEVDVLEPGFRQVRMGIIDFLTQWNAKKKAERVYKSIFKGGLCQEHSTMPPDYYQQRWVEYMDDKIVVAEGDQ